MADKPAAFLSYVHSDDDHDNGRISRIRERLEGEVRMHTGRPFYIFQDRNDLEWGQNWQERIDDSINEVTFLIPIVTPSYFASPACRKEYELFLLREDSLGTNQLILPLYYLEADEMGSGHHDPIGVSLRERQYSDWRGLRFQPLDGSDVSKLLADLAAMVKARILQFNSIKLAAKPTAKPSKPKGALDKIIWQIDRADISLRPPETSEKIEQPETATADVSPEAPYRVYTTQFDEIVQANKFVTGEEMLNLTKIATTLASDLSSKNRTMIAQFSSDLERYRGGKAASVILLLDNSGSLRGGPITYLSAWSLLLTEVFEGAGFNTEVIGFTTRAWKGGQSREKWLSDGRPPQPGRLNDLRYVIYKDFNQSFVATVQNFGVMLREGILKENIDGEAIQFAIRKLSDREDEIRLLLVISDGAPVDDSTASANGGTYLESHLKSVINEVKESGINFAAVGIDHDVKRYYGPNGRNSTTERIGVDASRIIRSVLDIKGGPRKKAPKKRKAVS